MVHAAQKLIDIPDRSSILVLVSMADLCCPGTGALRGMIVGTATAPAVILSVLAAVPEFSITNFTYDPGKLFHMPLIF